MEIDDDRELQSWRKPKQQSARREKIAGVSGMRFKAGYDKKRRGQLRKSALET